MKKLIVLFCLMAVSVFAQLGSWKTLTTADSVYDIKSKNQWVVVEVYDTSSADTITVWQPMTPVSTTYYAVVGSIKELATNDNVVGLYGDADAKTYILWFPYPTAIRFLLSDYASGSVLIKAYNKP